MRCKHRASISLTRHMSQYISCKNRILSNNNNDATPHVPGQYDDAAALSEGQYDHVIHANSSGIITVERSIATKYIHTPGNDDGRAAAAPLFTSHSAVVTPQLTATTPTCAKHHQAFDTLAEIDLEQSVLPSDDDSHFQVLLGSGGYTSNNPANLAAIEFCCSRSSTYKTLKVKDKQSFVKTAYQEFIKKGYSFWVKHEGCMERAPEWRALKYFRRKLLEGERKGKRAQYNDNKQRVP